MNTLLLKCMDVESTGVSFTDVMDMISKFAIVIALITLLINMRQTRRVNYMTCTAKYMGIQQLLTGSETLHALHLSIYKDKWNGKKMPEIVSTTKKSASEILSSEIALSAMMFQLMEDVWVIKKRSWISKLLESDTAYVGWKELFNDWLSTPEIREKWRVLESHYDPQFVKDTIRDYRLQDLYSSFH